jgi:quercetin dioxygenase-like cupin family protein
LQRRNGLRCNARIQDNPSQTMTHDETLPTYRFRGRFGRNDSRRKEIDIMSLETKRSRLVWRRVATAAAAAGALTLAAAANAGECPADQRRPDGSGQKPGATAPKDVTDKVIASTDLAKEKVALNDRLFRARRLDIKPGGIVPWHSHDNRPAMIYIVKGSVTEYASTCAVPIVHKVGDISPERLGTSHWWQNTGKETAVLISVDIFQVDAKADDKAM